MVKIAHVVQQNKISNRASVNNIKSKKIKDKLKNNQQRLGGFVIEEVVNGVASVNDSVESDSQNEDELELESNDDVEDVTNQPELDSVSENEEETSDNEDKSSDNEEESSDSEEESSDNGKEASVNEVAGSDIEEDSENGDQQLDSEDEDDARKHALSLSKLKETDPTFYEFLQENDDALLKFDVSDVEDGNSSENDNEPETHSSTTLQADSDESDFEPEDDSGGNVSSRNITLKMVKQWQDELQNATKVSIATLGCVVKAFNAALLRVSSDNEDTQQHTQYKVDGSSVFNAVVQLCVLHLQPAIRKFLGLTPATTKQPHKCKKWVKIKSLLKGYFSDLLKLLGVTSSNILAVLLKHLHQMSSLLNSFPHIATPLVKRLIVLWATCEESVRVLAFLCILRITRNQQVSLLDTVLKSMYMTYVKNCKFVSPVSLPAINFMRRSLTEMYALDVNVSYQHVFLYIRQLAIHLRNAITLQKKENLQAVYNWQYVNSIHLWADLLAATCNKPQLQPLVYPLVMIIVNTIRLIPTAQYYPLRFHCLQILINLSRDSGTFIPVLPFLLEILSSFDFNKKHKKVSMKPMQFTCVLRLSKSQMAENGFKDAVVDNVYSLMLEYLSVEAHTISFPDMVVPCVLTMKQFLKKCSVANYCKKMRQILEKIEMNAKHVENERAKVQFNISDIQLIEGWETTLKNNGTPIGTFYANWVKIHRIQKNKRSTNNDEVAEYDLPNLKKFKKASEKKEKEQKGPVELFPSDSEDDAPMFGEKAVTKRGKRGGKNITKNKQSDTQNGFNDLVTVNDAMDVVEDLKMSDWK